MEKHVLATLAVAIPEYSESENNSEEDEKCTVTYAKYQYKQYRYQIRGISIGTSFTVFTLRF